MCVSTHPFRLNFTQFHSKYNNNNKLLFLPKRYTLHTHTNKHTNLKQQSSIVISGVPTKSYRLPTEWIQPNPTVVNVASFKNVDEESLLKVPGVIYVPMVGKVTVAMLERNLMRLYEQFSNNNNNNSNNNNNNDDDDAINQVNSRVAKLEESVDEMKSMLMNIQSLLQQQK